MLDDHESLVEIIGLCGSFLTLRGHTIYFVHQSAKDYLLRKVYDKVFPSRIRDIHYTIFSRSLQVMSRTLRRDVYSLLSPGISIDQVKQPDPDPLAAARYSCLYWVDHLLDCNTRGNSNDDLKDGGSVYWIQYLQKSGAQLHDNDQDHQFLQVHLLHWLEALGWMGNIFEGVLAITSLESITLVSRLVAYHKVFN